jgi:hypothetical protein
MDHLFTGIRPERLYIISQVKAFVNRFLKVFFVFRLFSKKAKKQGASKRDTVFFRPQGTF